MAGWWVQSNGAVLATISKAHCRISLTGASGPWLWIALVLLAIESVVFAGNGFRCPLTDLAVRYGAKSGRVFDTFLPEKATRYTFRFFGTLMAVGLLLLVLRWAGIIG